MNDLKPQKFQLPDRYLGSLPTGAAKTAVDTIGRRIASGEFAVGETIPHEAELAAELKVSRTVLRDAIKVLSGKGLVRTARRYGTRVQPFESWNLMDPDVIRFHAPDSPMAARIFAESTAMRCAIEPEAAALAAENATDEQRELILSAAHSIDASHFGLEAMIAADYVFHSTILQGTGNLMLAQLQGLILALLEFSYVTGMRVVPDEAVSLRNHVAVAEAISNRQPEEARARMSFMLDQNKVVAKKMTRRLATG